MGIFYVGHSQHKTRPLGNMLHTDGAKRFLDRAMGNNSTNPVFKLGMSGQYGVEQPGGGENSVYPNLTESIVAASERISLNPALCAENLAANPYERKSVSGSFVPTGNGGIMTTSWVYWQNAKAWVSAEGDYANQSWWNPSLGYPYSVPAVEPETDLESSSRKPYDRFTACRAERYSSVPIRHFFLIDEAGTDILVASAVSDVELMIRPGARLYARFRCRIGFFAYELDSDTWSVSGEFAQEAARNAMHAYQPMQFRIGFGSYDGDIGPKTTLSNIFEATGDGYSRLPILFSYATANAGCAASSNTEYLEWENTGSVNWSEIDCLFVTFQRGDDDVKLAFMKRINPSVILTPGDKISIDIGEVQIGLNPYYV